MPKFALMGGYTSEAWKGMIDSRETRLAAVKRAVEAGGGTLDAFYWTFGDDDFMAIVEAPDNMAAAAMSVGTSSSGRLRHMRTIPLISADDEVTLLGKAGTVTAAYTPPGVRTG